MKRYDILYQLEDAVYRTDNNIKAMKKKKHRSRQDSNLCGQSPMDF